MRKASSSMVFSNRSFPTIFFFRDLRNDLANGIYGTSQFVLKQFFLLGTDLDRKMYLNRARLSFIVVCH